MDYKALCLELFGTTNEDELRRIAKEYGEFSPVNVGRKKQFVEGDVADMLSLQREGASYDEIAKRYNTSRQTISKYLSSKPSRDYPFVVDVMYGHTVVSSIYLNFKTEQVYVMNRSNDILSLPFGANNDPTWQDFQDYLLTRSFPENRGDKKQLLKALDVPFYDPWLIVMKTKGKTPDDSYWFNIKTLD